MRDPFEVRCPCCDARLRIDPDTEVILHHEQPKIPEKTSLEEALRSAEARQQEMGDKFQKCNHAPGHRSGAQGSAGSLIAAPQVGRLLAGPLIRRRAPACWPRVGAARVCGGRVPRRRHTPPLRGLRVTLASPVTGCTRRPL